MYIDWLLVCLRLCHVSPRSRVRKSTNPFLANSKTKSNPEINQPIPIGSMYGIFCYIYHKHQPNVGTYIPYMDSMGMAIHVPWFLVIFSRAVRHCVAVRRRIFLLSWTSIPHSSSTRTFRSECCPTRRCRNEKESIEIQPTCFLGNLRMSEVIALWFWTVSFSKLKQIDFKLSNEQHEIYTVFT